MPHMVRPLTLGVRPIHGIGSCQGHAHPAHNCAGCGHSSRRSAAAPRYVPGPEAARTRGPQDGDAGERLIEVLDEVVDVLDADREPDHVGGDPHRDQLLGVSCRCVVDAGWLTRDLASPMFTSRRNSFTRLKNPMPAS